MNCEPSPLSFAYHLFAYLLYLEEVHHDVYDYHPPNQIQHTTLEWYGSIVEVGYLQYVYPTQLPNNQDWHNLWDSADQSTKEGSIKEKSASKYKYSSLYPSKEFRENFSCVWTSWKILHRMKNILVQINHIIHFVLWKRKKSHQITKKQIRNGNTDTTLANYWTNWMCRISLPSGPEYRVVSYWLTKWSQRIFMPFFQGGVGIKKYDLVSYFLFQPTWAD